MWTDLGQVPIPGARHVGRIRLQSSAVCDASAFKLSVNGKEAVRGPDSQICDTNSSPWKCETHIDWTFANPFDISNPSSVRLSLESAAFDPIEAIFSGSATVTFYYY